ncbi:exported hypothetical protein [uncultured Desulfobacterium sp.]|uniref:DUF5666 domain-containing protein n=1 Tax=uncultured Desulfobacterium sp. TaxID=201089 RepID=A0A445MZI2_9BACT|nr:exported hypothetical protein [uncultured Desulfobacterium sp.]
MKNSVKSILVILAIVMSLVAVRSASAETVSGTIESISLKPNIVVVDGTAVNGVRLDYLCNQYNVCLEEGDTVTIDYYEYTCLSGTVKLIATSITAGDITVQLR